MASALISRSPLVLALLCALVYGQTPITINAGTTSVASGTPGVLLVDIQAPPGGDGSLINPFNSIQAALNAAIAGDQILVAPGTYFEHLNFLGKMVVLKSIDGPSLTIVDGSSNGTVMTFESGEGFGTQIEGFTIRNGLGASSAMNQSRGGGVHCSNSSPVILNCFIRNNVGGSGLNGTGEGSAGGVHCRGTAGPILISCRIIQNTGGTGFATFSAPATAGSGGLQVAVGAPILLNCVFWQNQGGNLVGSGGFSRDAGGGGISVTAFGTANIINCDLIDNTGGTATNASQGASGGINVGGSGLVVVTNCIVRGNNPAPGSTAPAQIGVSFGNPAPANVTYSNVEGGQLGTANFDANPSFVNPAAGDFHLDHGSSCVNVGTNSPPFVFPFDFEGHARIIDGTMDVGADERTPPFDECGDGTVGLGAGGPFDLLRVNGMVGGELRTVTKQPLTSLSISIDATPGEMGTNFLLFGQTGIPSVAEHYSTPWGEMCLTPSLAVPAPNRFLLTSSFDPALGFFPSYPAPWVFNLPMGLPAVGTIAMQAIIVDISDSGVEVSISNALVLCVR